MIRKIKKVIPLFITALVLVTFFSCNSTKKYEEDERATIQNYISQNSDKNFQLKPSGLYYQEVVAGTGAVPRTHDTAYIKYTGSFLDGTAFGSNILDLSTDSLKVPLNEGWLISGLEEGLNYMRVGGVANFLIPSNLAYGTAGSYPYIQGYTPLLFEIHLVRIKLGPDPVK